MLHKTNYITLEKKREFAAKEEPEGMKYQLKDKVLKSGLFGLNLRQIERRGKLRLTREKEKELEGISNSYNLTLRIDEKEKYFGRLSAMPCDFLNGRMVRKNNTKTRNQTGYIL